VAAGLGIPVVPGSDGPVQSLEEAQGISGEIGFPLIFKAVAGGGGRGMRVVNDPGELGLAFQTARSEAAAAFGSPEMYMERYLARPRHIEIQVMSDRHGRHAHLGERECSIQRRHQKLIEESPSPVVDEDLRRLLGDSAIRICEEIGYEGAGTVEFLLDEDGSHYFMEMNTRIQVEHPVTEMVMGFDLVKEQIRVAAGEPLSLPEGDLEPRGHAIEFRINAEDPETFVPSPGTITVFHAPGGPGTRVDTAAHAQCRISPYYDSLVAKIVVHCKDRADAIARGRRALDMTIIEGIRTNIDLHRRILDQPAFQEGNISTRFLDDLLHARSEAGEAESGAGPA
jgi:acetyl-CoA carboxylase biotin carboxylase subunit